MAIASNKMMNLDKDSSKILKRVVSENWKMYVKKYFLAFFFLGLVALSTAYTAYIIKDITNEVFVKQDLDLAFYIALSIFGIFTLRGFATYGYLIVLGQIANNMVVRYQRRTFQHLLTLGVEFHKSNRSAYLIGQINQNIGGMRNLMNNVVVVFARDLFTLIGLVSVMIYQDWFMSLMTLSVLPIIALVISGYVKRIRKVARQEVDLNARVNTVLIETSQGMEVVKAFTMEEQLSQNLKELTARAEVRSNRIVKLQAKTKPPTEILAGLAIGAVIAFGGYRVAKEGHDAGALFSFLTAAMLAYDPIRKLSTFRVKFERALVNARMLHEVLDMPPRQADKPDAPDLEIKGNAEIEFKNVIFSYEKDPVLKNVSIVAEAEKTTALVGPSGGGKSTMILLIQRFFDLDEGEILVAGQNIADITAYSLRKNIAYVPQHAVLFEGTIFENILYGRPDATEEEIYAAAKHAQAHEFILEQPDGYDTPVGEAGSNLSGGQRQRISIARAFLRNAPILLLDEATSALDNESEHLVQIALEKLVKGRTTIVIAHRLSTIRNADKIYVVEEGEISQMGSHTQLMKEKKGTYARLHTLHKKDAIEKKKPSGKLAAKGT